MFLLRIIIFIVLIAIAYPYLKKGSDFVIKRLPNEVSGSINKVNQQLKDIIKK